MNVSAAWKQRRERGARVRRGPLAGAHARTNSERGMSKRVRPEEEGKGPTAAVIELEAAVALAAQLEADKKALLAGA